ncbi:LysR family transcriptional regulator [Mycolicibacterium smegmatis]|uniref:Probable hydrogen peroxide-inducible genes activator n=2 Tax=Mycolicibacterium smegmatis (strain ATCC 700084 / mc(2)155) TaxID=246196 RepID=I7FZ77_MYCS2|nr:LysR family transcriptional regulator [Mycolicibacterium smegmatis]ABK75149.1 transcriptional regulator, LysR family protein [Mycolicibacterium smegmatis MC2 155]AFP38412.1 LysR family regulatory protein [Mycolicibacterium smegmatis MC2 155]AIU07202.1 LysR family transcriptional regulator [Mycolicibacterium smegmatis MC2 155]AIU13827.1 LysR family transcriptional regulator [Mycolicibacterium smegmatis]AIU20451.1 LysR family transcriptional regulator [Mycolicibacterium smegmatis]
MADVGDLEFFVTLAAAGTMTEAARHWGVSVSVVSRRLKALEERLGTPLVHRRARGLELTAEGQQYHVRGSEILQQLKDLESTLNPDPKDLTGSIRVISTVGLGRVHIAPLLHDFRRRHRSVEISLELTSLPLSASVPGFDIAIQVGRVRDSSLAIRQLLPNRRVVVASPDYLDAHGAPADLDDLKNHELLVVRENEGESIWRFVKDGRETAIPVRGGLICNDGIAVTEWCLAGAGLAMRSIWHVAPYVREGRLVHVLPDVETPEADVVALFDAGVRTSPRVRTLLSFLRKQLAQRCIPLPTRQAGAALHW